MTYYAANAGARGTVYLDGNEISHIIWCDTEEGCLERMVYPFKVKNDKFVTELLYGQITVKPLEG